MRDPLNFFASRLRIWDDLSGVRDLDEVAGIWKSHVREALGETNHLGLDKVVANFTRWTRDVSYRRDLASTLGLEFSDRGRSVMQRVGPGSSFDQFAYESNALAMKVNERWKGLSEDARFRAVLSDPEVQELSWALFGEMEGWAVLQDGIKV